MARSKMTPDALNRAGRNLSSSSYGSAFAAVRGPASRCGVPTHGTSSPSRISLSSADHPGLLGLVEGLGSYEGSGVPEAR
ncbi:hypothetical protein HCN51_25985 [Nonomuraea sp. FMUSA5-5]|uniref:Uncharacterized protein n=1 Tax=Nonomuraea composti TaxID=2720023 RepID=A0ABX1BDC7_9ACTN|nr:hypothetical protein [Nonomuraea sp. FMUSA5-5]NJP92863.1 hypothetical protein [Nonomuraea sp. FMUSA5-5]